jgi:hypothetical protein
MALAGARGGCVRQGVQGGRAGLRRTRLRRGRGGGARARGLRGLWLRLRGGRRAGQRHEKAQVRRQQRKGGAAGGAGRGRLGAGGLRERGVRALLSDGERASLLELPSHVDASAPVPVQRAHKRPRCPAHTARTGAAAPPPPPPAGAPAASGAAVRFSRASSGADSHSVAGRSSRLPSSSPHGPASPTATPYGPGPPTPKPGGAMSPGAPHHAGGGGALQARLRRRQPKPLPAGAALPSEEPWHAAACGRAAVPPCGADATDITGHVSSCALGPPPAPPAEALRPPCRRPASAGPGSGTAAAAATGVGRKRCGAAGSASGRCAQSAAGRPCAAPAAAGSCSYAWSDPATRPSRPPPRAALFSSSRRSSHSSTTRLPPSAPAPLPPSGGADEAAAPRAPPPSAAKAFRPGAAPACASWGARARALAAPRRQEGEVGMARPAARRVPCGAGAGACCVCGAPPPL